MKAGNGGSGQYWTNEPSILSRINVEGRSLKYVYFAFISGHATQAAATAIVLTDIYGEPFAFTDDTHATRERDTAQKVDFKARSFKSFWETAEESAYSRFLGGIHTRQDNTQGLAVGRQVGYNINKLGWRK